MSSLDFYISSHQLKPLSEGVTEHRRETLDVPQNQVVREREVVQIGRDHLQLACVEHGHPDV